MTQPNDYWSPGFIDSVVRWSGGAGEGLPEAPLPGCAEGGRGIGLLSIASPPASASHQAARAYNGPCVSGRRSQRGRRQAGGGTSWAGPRKATGRASSTSARTTWAGPGRETGSQPGEALNGPVSPASHSLATAG